MSTAASSIPVMQQTTQQKSNSINNTNIQITDKVVQQKQGSNVGLIEYKYIPHNLLSTNECIVELSINWLERNLQEQRYIMSSQFNKIEDLRIQCTLYSLGLRLHESQQVSSSFASGSLVSHEYSRYNQDYAVSNASSINLSETLQQFQYKFQNEIIRLPAKINDLHRDSYVLFEVLDCYECLLYTCQLSLFDDLGVLRSGLQKIQLHSIQAEEEEEEEEDNYKVEDDAAWSARLIIQDINEHKNESKCEWLDQMTLEACHEEIQSFQAYYQSSSFLIVSLPKSPIPIIYEESFYPYPTHGASSGSIVTPLQLSLYRSSLNNQQRQQKQDEIEIGTSSNNPLSLVQIMDYENEDDNPFQDKYRTLAHDLLRGLVDPALKPDKQQKAKLDSIINSSNTHLHFLSSDEKDLLWRFRFQLVDNRKALTKFLVAVDWTNEHEVIQAAELLNQWRKRSPIEITDALKLLGKDVAFQTSLVRAYAIDTLQAAPDAELNLYLLQLVQALRYEDHVVDDIIAKQQHQKKYNRQVSPLARFLINRAVTNLTLANYLYWYLKVEVQSTTNNMNMTITNTNNTTTTPSPASSNNAANANQTTMTYTEKYKLIFLALRQKLSSTPYHHSNQETISPQLSSQISSSSFKKNNRTITLWDVLHTQDQYISSLLEIQKKSRESRGKKDAKEIFLKETLAEQSFFSSATVKSVPLPTHPQVFVTGANPTSARMFKSALYPALLEFYNSTPELSTTSTTTTKIIIKTGDDLRQDQLFIMMVRLMDKLLKRGMLDLCLRSYSIIATSPDSGLIEFVQNSMPLSHILQHYQNSILLFFQTVSWHDTAKYNIQPNVLQTYIRSCAGYCVITYLLGVGDRHLDNIMLLPTGHFFHIDFGFLFGRDPKPLPPLFRLTKEMVEGMGGVNSSEYSQFTSFACQAFNLLRKNAPLILNLLHLMSDAGIEDIMNNPYGDAITKVEERFRLELSDEQAEIYFMGLISETLNAFAPRVMDVFHQIAVSRR